MGGPCSTQHSTSRRQRLLIPRTYALDAIDGHPSPTPSIADAIGDITFVYAGTVALDGRGNAVLAQRRRAVWRSSTSPQEAHTLRDGYAIIRDSIAVGPVGACRDLCPRTIMGAFSDSVLTLGYGVNVDGGPVFHYHRVGPN